MIQQAIVKLITDLVPSINGRITPILREDNAPLPAITYQSGSSSKDHNLNGKATGIVRHKLEIDVWGETYASVKEIEDLLFELDGFIGVVEGVNIGYLRVQLAGDDLDAEPEIQTTAITFNIITTGN